MIYDEEYFYTRRKIFIEVFKTQKYVIQTQKRACFCHKILRNMSALRGGYFINITEYNIPSGEYWAVTGLP